jgi:hypothetical protein
MTILVKPYILDNMGCSLQEQSSWFDYLENIEKAILMHQQSVNLAPDNHPDRAIYLKNLGSCLWERFRRFSNIADIGIAER